MTNAATKTFRSGRMVVEFTHTETRGVLAGAYKGKDISERTLLTHLVFMLGEDEQRPGCSVPHDSIVDTYGSTDAEKAARPTCPACAKKWDRVTAG